MSLGYFGICEKVSENENIAVYSYAGENWNDGGVSRPGDAQLQDGLFTIDKTCIGTDLRVCLQTGKIVITQTCRNAFYETGIPVDHIAWRLLNHIFAYYEKNRHFPARESFIQ